MDDVPDLSGYRVKLRTMHLLIRWWCWSWGLFTL